MGQGASSDRAIRPSSSEGQSMTRPLIRAAGLALAVGVVLRPSPTTAQVTGTTIPAGVDCFSTECGETKVTFCQHPIPPDFFASGSEPFTGSVRLGGPTAGSPDTQVQRMNDLSLPRVGDVGTVPIEIVQLSLVSCEPIKVMIRGSPTQWDVKVDLSPMHPPPPGTMTVRKTHPNGGTFDAQFYVQPLFTFTRVGGTEVLQLDTGAVGAPPDQLMTHAAPWVHQVQPSVQAMSCGVNFVPGIQEATKGPDAGAQCCVPVCHAGATATHCVVQGLDCSRCPPGACCFGGHGDGRCRVIGPSRSASAAQRCQAHGGQYFGDGTD